MNTDARGMIFFLKNSNYDIDFVRKILHHELVQDIVTLNICVKLYQTLSINIGDRAYGDFFSKNNKCDHDFGPTMLKEKKSQTLPYLSSV